MPKPYKNVFSYTPIGNISAMSTTTGATTTYTYAETSYTIRKPYTYTVRVVILFP